MHTSPESLATQLSALSERLHVSRDFEAAGKHLLLAMVDAIQAALPQGATVLRGAIHFRPEDEYRRLFSLECVPRLDPHPLRLPSLTAWRWIASRGCPVTIDVESQLLRVYEGGLPRVFRAASNAIHLDAGETCQRLTSRDVDYVVAYPLRRPAGVVDGMVSLELHGAACAGDRIPEICGAAQQVLVDLAAPHLAWLPGTVTSSPPGGDDYLPVVGAATAPVVDLLRVFSRLEETLLITGPTGVGKSRLARYCHAHSSRKDKPFVTLDLLSCPENLQMPQLFGSKKGAYTGADRDLPGAIQRSQGGTLFIDEIDKLSLPAQAGLLRLLEERTYRAIGDCGDDRRADVRFVVGTSANLRDAVTRGQFREDLYYRIAVLVIRVPPLAQRMDEVSAWANYMLERCHALAHGTSSSGRVQLDALALEHLQRQSWPGNLRQLDNVVRRAHAYSLLAHDASDGLLYVRADSMARAIRDEEMEPSRDNSHSSIAVQMRTAAQCYATESLRRADSTRPLPLTYADAFRAMVLEAAMEACGNDKDIALEALGLGSVVRDRNHYRVLKCEAEQLQRFYAALAHPLDG